MNGNIIEHRRCTISLPLLQILLIEGKYYGTDDMSQANCGFGERPQLDVRKTFIISLYNIVLKTFGVVYIYALLTVVTTKYAIYMHK